MISLMSKSSSLFSATGSRRTSQRPRPFLTQHLVGIAAQNNLQTLGATVHLRRDAEIRSSFKICTDACVLSDVTIGGRVSH